MALAIQEPLGWAWQRAKAVDACSRKLLDGLPRSLGEVQPASLQGLGFRA